MAVGSVYQEGMDFLHDVEIAGLSVLCVPCLIGCILVSRARPLRVWPARLVAYCLVYAACSCGKRQWGVPRGDGFPDIETAGWSLGAHIS